MNTKFTLKTSTAGFGVLCILILWNITYPYSCFSWIFPFLIFILIAYGQFEFFMRYRKCRADCLFNKESWIYDLTTRKPLVVLYAIAIAIPLTLSLVSFTALSTITDGLFLLLSSVITMFIFPFLSKFLRNHVSKDMLGIMVKRTVVILTMVLMLILYSYISYNYIEVPSYLDPSSIRNTVDTASQEVASICSITNLFLKWFQEIDAANWYGMVIGSKKIESESAIQLAWLMFFITHAFVFAALARAQVELMTRIFKNEAEGKKRV